MLLALYSREKTERNRGGEKRNKRGIPKPSKQLVKLSKREKSFQALNLNPTHPPLSKFGMLNTHPSNQNVTKQNPCHNGKT